MSLGILILTVSTVQRLLNPAAFGVILPDYLAHWTGGVLLLDGFSADLYSIERQVSVQAPINGTTSVVSWFVSPPLVAALYAPLALIEYTPSAGLWVVINVVMFVICVRSMKILAPALNVRKGGLVTLVLCASAPVFELLGGGQDSAFVLGVWLLAIRLINGRHQFVAGAVLGLALLKPQHVMLVPLVLLVTRRYGAFAGFLLMAIVQAGLSFALVGSAGLGRWIGALTGPSFGEGVQQDQAWKMVSVPAFIHAVLPGATPYVVVAILTSLITVAATAVLVLRLTQMPSEACGDVKGVAQQPTGLVVLMATLSTIVVFSPHLVLYDAVLIFPVALFLLENRPTVAVRLSLAAAFCTSWLASVLESTVGQLVWPFSVGAAPWTAVPMLILWVECLRLLKRSDAPTAETATSTA